MDRKIRRENKSISFPKRHPDRIIFGLIALHHDVCAWDCMSFEFLNITLTVCLMLCNLPELELPQKHASV